MSSPHDTAVPKLFYQADSFFNELYSRGLEVTGTPEAKRRRERFYNLVQLFILSSELDGLIAECGCWRGLSSFILCHYSKKEMPSFDGAGYHIVDSFKGLSKPTNVDALSGALVAELTEKFGGPEGAYAASLPDVKSALAEFPNIEYHEGWIPSVFEGFPEGRYRFVHVDLDLYEPTRASIEYFYPRLVDGGLIVCDDYGSLLWPGAKQAVDSYCIESGVPLLRVSTGQAVILKRGPVVKARSNRVVASLRHSLADAQMEVNRLRSERLGVEMTVKAAMRNEKDELKAQLTKLSARFGEVKAAARARQEELLAQLSQMRKQRDELRAKLLQIREERDKAKARALDFEKRLADVEEQLLQQTSDTAQQRPSSAD